MASHDLPGENPNGDFPDTKTAASKAKFEFTFVDSSFFLVSLVRQIRERIREPKGEAKSQREAKTQIASARKFHRRPAPLPLTEMPAWYRDLPHQLRVLFEKPEPLLAPLTSQPIDVPSIWQDYQQQPGSWLNSLLFHTLVISALILPFAVPRPLTVRVRPKTNFTLIYSPAIPDAAHGAAAPHGGGGGGDKSPAPASRGILPKFAAEQLAPPMLTALDSIAKLAVAPTLIGAPQLKLPQMQADPQWGDPHSVLSARSNGPGSRGGMGDGDDGGIGGGRGPGFGPGEGGYTGGGPPVYSVGGGVTAPREVFSPAPDYSEEARKAKFQGVVTLSLIVDAQGNPADIRVVRSLGMGLTEKAVEKVRTWKFIPGMRNRVPVAVRVTLEVTFRLF